MAVRFQKFNRPTSQGLKEEKEMMQRLREEHLGIRNADGTTPEVLFSGTLKGGGGSITTSKNGMNFHSHQAGGKTGRYMERIDEIREKTQIFGTQKQNKKLNLQTKNVGNKLQDAYSGRINNRDIEDLQIQNKLNNMVSKTQTIQNMANVLEKIGTENRIIKDGKLYNNPLEARLDGYQQMCDKNKEANQANKEFQNMRKQMYGYTDNHKHGPAENPCSNLMCVISRDEAVQKVFEKYNKKPLLDDAAEALLKRNTKRRAGLSDAPKSFKEAIKAMPGYDLPLIRKRQGPLREDLVDVISPGYTKQVEQFNSSRGSSQNPVSDISIKNVSNSYSFGSSFFTKFKPDRMTTIAQSSLMNTKQFHETMKPKLQKEAPKVQKDVKRIMERASASPPKKKFEPSFVPDPRLEHNSPMSMMLRSLQTEKEQMNKFMSSVSSKNSANALQDALQDKAQNMKQQFEVNQRNGDSLRQRSLKIVRKHNLSIFKSIDKTVSVISKNYKVREPSIEYKKSRLSPQVGNRPQFESIRENSQSVIEPAAAADRSPMVLNHGAVVGKRGATIVTYNSNNEIVQGSKGFLDLSKSTKNSLDESKPSSNRYKQQQRNNILSIQPQQQKKTTWTVHHAERSEALKRNLKVAKQLSRYKQTQVLPSKQKDRESNNNLDIQQELVNKNAMQQEMINKSIGLEAKKVFSTLDSPDLRKQSNRKKSIKKEKTKSFQDSRGSGQLYKTQIGERGDEDQVKIMTSKEEKEQLSRKVLPKRNINDFKQFDTAGVKKTDEMIRTFNHSGSPKEEVPRLDFLSKRYSQPSELKQSSVQRSGALESENEFQIKELPQNSNRIQKQGENFSENKTPFESSALGKTSRLGKQKDEVFQKWIDQSNSKYNSPGVVKNASPLHERKISIEQPYTITPHMVNGLQNYTVDMFDNSPVGISQMSVRESINSPNKVHAVMPQGSLMMFGANDRSSLLRSSVKNQELDESFPSKMENQKDICENQSQVPKSIVEQFVKDNSQQNNSMIQNENTVSDSQKLGKNSQQFYRKENNETIQVISFDVNKDITKTTLNMKSGSLQKFEEGEAQAFDLIEEDLKEQIMSEEQTLESNVNLQQPVIEQQKKFVDEMKFIAMGTPSNQSTSKKETDYKAEFDYLYHQMDPKLNQIEQKQTSPRVTRKANKASEFSLTANSKIFGKQSTFNQETNLSQVSKKWMNSDGTKLANPLPPKIADRSKTVDISTEQRAEVLSLKNVEEESINIDLPSPEIGMKKYRDSSIDSGSQMIDEQYIRKSISKAVKKITRLKGSRGVVGLVQRLTRAKGQKRDDVQLIQSLNEEEENVSPLSKHIKFLEHQKRPSKWLGFADKTPGGKPKSFTLRELEKQMFNKVSEYRAKTMYINDNSDLNDLDSRKLSEESKFDVLNRRISLCKKEKNSQDQMDARVSNKTLSNKRGSKTSQGSEQSFYQFGVPKDHDWEKTPIYRQFVLHEPEEESLKDTEIMRRMIKEILDDKKKKLNKGKSLKGKRFDSKLSSLDSARDFNADKYGKEIHLEALQRTRKKMLGEVEIDYLLEMLKKKDVNKEIVQESEKKLYFKKAKVTLEVHMAKMGLAALYRTIIEQYETKEKLEKSKPFDETLIKLLYRCLMNKRSIQKAQKIFKLIEKRDQLLHEFEDLVTPCGQAKHQDAELLSVSRRVVQQEKLLAHVCQQSSRLFVQVAQFLDESNHFKGNKFIYQQCDLQKVLREDILRLRLEYQPIFINTIPIMDKYGRLQFNQDRSNDNANIVSLKAKDENYAKSATQGEVLTGFKPLDPLSSSAGFQGWNTHRDRPLGLEQRGENEAIEEEEEHGESSYDSEYSYFD